MCGICGFTGNDAGVLKSMCDSMRHRGPDSESLWSSEDLQMGMRRLSIVDLESTQPVFNEDKNLVVVMNGEIYNYIELKKELEGFGHKFRYDHSDVELVPHLYEQFGSDWPNHVNGMFAVAIWNTCEKRLELFRDRLGKKPLYYSQYGSFFAFASEIKTLLRHPKVSKDIDYNSVCDYFAKKATVAPFTIYSSIKQLLPGSSLLWDGVSVSTKSYWSPEMRVDDTLNIEEAKEEFLRLFRDSVSIRTRCDVPFGAYLSGGVDSSSVVAILSELGKTVKTFCLGYDTSTLKNWRGKALDLELSKHVSKIYGTDHYEIIITADDFKNSFTKILSAFDEPFSGNVSNYFVSKLIHEHVKVALSGDGADELFGSYLAHRVAEPIGHLLREKSSLVNGGSQWRKNLFVFGREEAQKLLNTELFLKYSPPTGLHGIFDDNVNKVLLEDQIDLLPNQVFPFVDRLSMAHSVEVRCPYMDYRIVEFANRLPGKYKVSSIYTKKIQKEALYSILPREIIERKKEGFVQPIYYWINNELNYWIRDSLEALPSCIINMDYVKKLDFSADLSKIWNLVCFSIWWNTQENQ